MKWCTGMVMGGLLLTANVSLAMTTVNERVDGEVLSKTADAPLRGNITLLDISASKVLIDGRTYAFSPVSTVVMVNGKRANIRELKVGDAVQFTRSESAPWPGLTSINVLRP